MAASRVDRWRGPHCSGSWRQSARGSSMWWWSTRVDRLTRSLADFAKLVEILRCPRGLVRLGDPVLSRRACCDRRPRRVRHESSPRYVKTRGSRGIRGGAIRNKLPAHQRVFRLGSRAPAVAVGPWSRELREPLSDVLLGRKSLSRSRHSPSVLGGAPGTIPRSRQRLFAASNARHGLFFGMEVRNMEREFGRAISEKNVGRRGHKGVRRNR